MVLFTPNSIVLLLTPLQYKKWVLICKWLPQNRDNKLSRNYASYVDGTREQVWQKNTGGSNSIYWQWCGLGYHEYRYGYRAGLFLPVQVGLMGLWFLRFLMINYLQCTFSTPII